MIECADVERTKERFLAKIIKDENGCWLWTAAKLPNGYGHVTINKNGFYAHRAAYELFVGEIPEGLQIDHLCRVRNCVNPSHLEAVTCRENLRRGIGFVGKQMSQTHCKRGHPLSGRNLQMSDGTRQCRTCIMGRNRVQYLKRSAKLGRKSRVRTISKAYSLLFELGMEVN